MPSDLAVRIEDLSITYKINVDTKKTLKNAVMRASKGEKVRMRELVKEARTIVIVSHALQTVKDLCTHAIWMHKGQMIAQGKPDEITERYLEFLNVGTLPSNLEDM